MVTPRTIKQAGRSFVRRAFWPRVIGLGAGFFCIGGVYWEQGRPLWQWALLALFCFVWPWLARALSLRSARPFVSERRYVLFDSFASAFCVATIDFNLLPSVAIFALLSMNNVAAGGARFALLGFAFQAAAIAVAGLLFGLRVSLETTPLQLYACIPSLVLHPITIGLVLYNLAMQLGAHKRTLRQVSRTDSLTGLFNRGHWTSLLQHQLEQCLGEGRPASVALIDIDYFKEINDQHGHMVGDRVLQAVGECMRDALRAGDLPGRYGGDEFCVLLPNTSAQTAFRVLERVRRRVAELRVEQVPELRVGLSVGVAGHQAPLADAVSWLREADRALYEAKRAGRNQTVVAEPVDRAATTQPLTPLASAPATGPDLPAAAL